MGEEYPPVFEGGATKERPTTVRCEGVTGGAYGLGFLGALIYYIQTATGFWDGAFGVLQALLWPAFLVYDVLRFVGA